MSGQSPGRRGGSQLKAGSLVVVSPPAAGTTDDDLVGFFASKSILEGNGAGKAIIKQLN